MQSAKASKEALHTLYAAFSANKNVKIYPQGTSMLPLLKEKRDSVILAPADGHSVRRGDILLYQRANGLLILHRLHKIKKDGLYLSGDNQTQMEGPVLPEQIIAVVTKITRKNHTFSTKHFFYVLYSRFWILTRPVRPYIAKIMRKSIPNIDKR